MSVLVKKICTLSICLTVLAAYLLGIWFFVHFLELNLLVSNVFIYSGTVIVILVLYKKYYLRASNEQLSVLSVTASSLLGLSINEYFIYFFTVYGKIEDIIAVLLAIVISLVYFVAFNVFFGLNKINLSLKN